MEREKRNSNWLLQYFLKNDKNMIDKWLHYLSLYHRYFKKFLKLNRPIRILEIGVFQGGSLQMWKEYFGGKGKVEVYGLDINANCKKFEQEDNEGVIKILLGDQADISFLQQLTSTNQPFDIIIDDGGHLPDQQKNSFSILFNHLNAGGVYLVEDVHTSYFASHFGGYKNPVTFMEYSKNKLDELNAYHSENKQVLHPTFITENCSGIYFHDSIIVFEKSMGKITAPYSERHGQIRWQW